MVAQVVALNRESKLAVTFDRFYLFSFAWAVATVLHTSSFLRRLNWQHPSAVALTLMAALVLLRPQSIWLFLLLLCFSIGNTLEWLPYAPNHITLELLLNAGILLALTWRISRYYNAGSTVRSLRNPAIREELFASFAPFARVSLLLLYFWTVFHKLNWDYLNVRISCSNFLLDNYVTRFPSFPYHSALLRWLTVWGTLVIETAIPLLLWKRRTRAFGILLCLTFHYFLALNPYPGLYSFSAFLFALCLLFVPAELPEQLRVLARAWLGGVRYQLLAAFRLLAALSVVGIVLLAVNGTSSAKIGFYIWLAWSAVFIIGFASTIGRRKFIWEKATTLLRVRPLVFWLIPLLVFFNGLMPYLGLKTENSFSMFSNLRVEGGSSNHLFMPVSMQLTDLEKDLVDVVDTNLTDLQPFVTRNQFITFFELRRLASQAYAAHVNFYVRYVRHQHLQTLRVADGHSSQPGVTKAHSWFTTKFIYFRPVDKGPCLCKH